MPARMFVWPEYVLEVDGKRATLPRTAGAAVARMFRSPGHFISNEDLVEAVYFDDPDGGPVSAVESLKICLWRARHVLAGIEAAVQGWQGRGGHRLLFPWHDPLCPFREIDLATVGHHGPRSYVIPDPAPCAYGVADLAALNPRHGPRNIKRPVADYLH